MIFPLKEQGILQGHARREIEKIKRMMGKAVLLVSLAVLAVVLEHVAMVDAQNNSLPPAPSVTIPTEY